MVANKRRLKDIDQKVERLQSDVSRREIGLEPILTTHDSNRYTLGRDASQQGVDHRRKNTQMFDINTNSNTSTNYLL